jgi:hypothetical protein
MKRETARQVISGPGQHCRIQMLLLALRSAVVNSLHSSYRIPRALSGNTLTGVFAYHYLHDNHTRIVSSSSILIPFKHQYSC